MIAKRILKKILFPLISLLWVGCVTQPQSTSPSFTDEEHPYNNAQVRSFGDQPYHAAMKYDAVEGVVQIEFLGRNGSPKDIFKAKKAEAILKYPGGKRREFFLYNPEIAGNFIMEFFSKRGPGSIKPARMILAREKWLKNLPAFNLTVWIPIEGKTYKMRYDYSGQKGT